MGNLVQSLSKSATAIIIMILTSFFAASILVLTFMMNPEFLVGMYKTGLWGMVYMFMGVWFLATTITVIVIWFVLKRKVTIGDALAG